jgi:DNA-binding NarL/FixJ family response regulator
MKIMLSQVEQFAVVGEAYNGLDFLDVLPNLDIDLVLMDIDMPGLNGIDTAKQAFKIRPDLKIITVSMFDDFDSYNKVIEAGVHGFVVKSAHKEELIDAIDAVMVRDKYFSSQLLENAIEFMSSRKDKSVVKHLLSEREKEVLELICDGMSSNEIGEELGISPRTVEKHRDSLLRKTKSKNSVILAVFAVQYGLVKR